MKKVLLIGISMLLMTSCELIDGLDKALHDKMSNPSELTLVTPRFEEHYEAGVEKVQENQGNWFFRYICDQDWWNSDNSQKVGFYLSYYRTHLSGEKELKLELNSCNLSLPEVGTPYPVTTQEYCNSLGGDYHGIEPTRIEWNSKTMYATEGTVTFTKLDLDDAGKGTISATFELTAVDNEGNTYLIKDGIFTDAECKYSNYIYFKSLFENTYE